MNAWLELDRPSLLVHVDGQTELHVLEAELRAQALTLDAAIDENVTVEQWLAEGAPGTRSHWWDPADHLVAGFHATIGRESVTIKPAPRRATGPDLFALLFGLGGRLGRIHDAWLRIHRAGSPRASVAPFAYVDPPLSVEEDAILERVRASLRR